MSRSGQKPTVAQTCNLLSQFLKENGRFAPSLNANKGVEASRQQQQATTMNLLPNLEKCNDSFANIPSFASSFSNLKNDAELENGNSCQMTMFYNGKVFVFNDFPAQKANEIMALAIRSSSSSSSTVLTETNMASTAGDNTINNKKNNIATPAQFASASLRRFFEKRKDRSAASAPYQVKTPSMEPPKREDQSKYPGLELEGQSSKQLDLNL